MYFRIHRNCVKVGMINLLKNNFEIIQHEVSYCITATNFIVIGYLINCALHLKCITRNLFSKKNIQLKNYIPRHQDLLSHHNSVIDSCKPHKRSTSYDTSLFWCSSFQPQKPETNDPLFSKNCKKNFGVMIVSFGNSVLFQKLGIMYSFTFPPHLGQLLGSPSSPGMTEQSEAPAY